MTPNQARRDQLRTRIDSEKQLDAGLFTVVTSGDFMALLQRGDDEGASR